MKNRMSKIFDQTFWKFIIVGIINTIFGTAIMFLFYNVLHLNYWISSGSNYFFGSILSYFLNKYFTFNNKEKNTGTIIKFIINIVLCYFLAYGISKPLMLQILSKYSKTFQENMAMLFGMCLFVALNYCGQRFFVFKANTRNKRGK